jgi:hypothetical protein
MTVVLLFTNFLTINIPCFLGIVDYNGDTVIHQVLVNNIINNGSYGKNQYPVIHIIASILCLITGKKVGEVTIYLAPLLVIISYIFIYLLTKCFFSSKIAIFTILIYSITFYMNTSYNKFTPYTLATLFMPFILYLLFKINKFKTNFYIIPIICIIIYPFFHPLSTIFLLISILIFIIFTLFINIKEKTNMDYATIVPIIGIFIIGALMLNYNIFITNNFSGFFLLFINSIFINYENYEIIKINQALSFSHLSNIDFIILLLKMKIDEIIYIFSYTVSGLILLFNIIKGKKINKILILWTTLSISILFYVSAIFGFIPGISSIEGERLYDVFLIFSPIFMSYLIYIYHRKKVVYLIYFLIISSSILSIPDLYYSPYNKQLLDIFDKKNVDGIAFYLNHSNDYPVFESYSFDQFRLSYVTNFYHLENRIIEHFPIPYHFIFNNTINSDYYMFYNSYFTSQYLKLWLNLNLYNYNDFISLYNKFSINKIYDNSEFKIYYINNKKM